MEDKKLSIYIHIPFCAAKCLYCDFLSFQGAEQYFERYKNALIREIESFKNPEKYNVCTIFFGGGTPSVFPPEFFYEICNALYKKFNISSDLELSVEANPGTLSEDILNNFMLCGVNRLSIGAQSFDDKILKIIGRIHTSSVFFKSFELIRRKGFDNVNIDLMFSLPFQSLSCWESTLKTAVELEPEHISAYSLIIEENTPIYGLYKNGSLDLPDERTDREMYYAAKDILKSSGYEHYEISNFAKEGFRSKHNTVYWKREEYIGFGLGAASFLNGFRFKNTDNMELYLDGCAYEQIEKIKDRDAYSEFIFLGLRMMEGISISEFENCFGISIFENYSSQIENLIKQGLLVMDKDRLYLTERGIDVSNSVFVEFL